MIEVPVGAMPERLPLFPLGVVLFPGGRLPLRIFETRYMDMVKRCLKDETPFGICLIADGQETGKPARPHATGTLAHIASWDMETLGILEIVVSGGERFRVLAHAADANGLVTGEVRALPVAPVTPIPARFARLVPLLRAIIAELGNAANAPAAPHRFFDAGWVGMRYAEMLPIGRAARQSLLEIDDPLDRLEIIFRFLEGKSLLPDAGSGEAT